MLSSSALRPAESAPRAVPPPLTPEVPTDCTHCGLPVPRGLIEPGQATQFCCHGCRTAYAVIHAAGLERYYEYRDETERREPARSTGRSYAELDDAEFRRLHCRSVGAELSAVELFVEAIHCSACIWLVERGLTQLDGTIEATLDVTRSVVRIVFDPKRVALSTLARRLDSLGYPVHPPQRSAALDARRREERALLARVAVAGACAGNVMLMAFALYGGVWSGMEAQFSHFFRWASLLAALPAVGWAAQPFYRGAFAALRTRTPHIDLPVTLGILAGFGGGAVNTLRGSGEIYFDSITALVFLLLVGRFLQRRRMHQARDAAELLHALAPSTARLVEGDAIREVAISAVPRGASVEVRALDTVPVDGSVVDGSSALDVALLTGESRPLEVEPGDRLHAGSVNLGARLIVRVEESGEATRLGRLVQSMERARARRAPVVVLADRVAGWFIIAVVALAALTLSVWLVLDPSRAVDHTVALLVVTCPCALGMATPLAVSIALGRAARAGILIKGGDALEALARPGLVLFDKTGTLTEGKLEVVAWEGDIAVQPLVHTLESHSAHPIATAITSFTRASAESRGASDATEVEQTVGGGIRGRLDGHSVVVGSPAYVARAASAPAWLDVAIGRQVALGRTPVAVAVDGQVLALAALGDPLRKGVKGCFSKLRELGDEVAIASGDHSEVVRAVADEIGEPLVFERGGVSPEEKLALVEDARAQGAVIMVGDGVNDAAALSAATVGVAVHGGAEASLAAADVFMTRGGIAPVV